MLQAIVRFALRHRLVVLALALALLGDAVFELVARARYDVFPEFAPPEVDVRTRAPGLSPEQVEVLVTRPVEYALVGVEGVSKLRSASIQGISVVTVVFSPSTDVFRARQLVGERLAGLGAVLPSFVEPPLMMPLTSSTSVVMVLGLTSKSRSPMDLRTLADWTVKPRLLAVPGVAKVAVFGTGEREIRIAFRPERLLAHHLSLDDLRAAARRATGVRGAGVVVTDNQRLVLRAEAPAPSARDVASTVVAWEAGRALTIGDLADVRAAPAVPIGAAAIEGRPGMMIVASGQYGANTVDVTRGIERALSDLAPTLEAEEVTLHADLFRPADFIATAVGNLERSLLFGAILVVVVLLLFLFDLRTAAISLTAIPLSLLAGVVVLERLGYSLDTMTLGGLAIAIGEVVDDAVIDVENILRRLRENRALGSPRPVLRVVLDASLEVRSAVIYATFAVLLVFVPILALPGVAGRLFSPLGVAYVSAILASLVVALTVTPALSVILLARRRRPEREPPVMRGVKRAYGAVLRAVERHPLPIVAAVVVVTAAGFALVPFLHAAFIPHLHENHYIVHMAAVPGTSLAESMRLGGRVTRELSALPFVRKVAQRAGRADEADDVLGTHESEIEVDLSFAGGLTPEEALARIREVLRRFPSANFSVNGFLAERIDETVSGEVSAVVVNVFGSDLDAIAAEAERVAAVLRGVPGARDVAVVSPPGAPQIAVRLRPDELRRWGLATTDVLDAASTAYQGAVVGQVYPGDRIFDVVLVLDAAERARPARVRDLPLRNRDGTWVRLGQVADVYETTGRYSILHRGARRVQTVTANVAGRSAASLVAAAREAIAEKAPPPKGTYLEWAGAAEEQAAFQRSLMVNASLAALGIVLLLSMVLRSWRNLLLVLLDLPFAVVGGIAAAWLALGGTLSLGAMVGFVTVFGITLRNSIMLVSHYEHLVEVEGETWGPEAALRGASERVAPILMTALVTALGLLPLALGAGAAGREIEGPMAVVILGGLFTSTALNLLVLPTLALRFGRFRPREDPFEAEGASAPAG